MLEAFDTWVMRWTGEHVRNSLTANKLITFLQLNSIKLLPLVSCLWLLWFARTSRPRARQAVVAGLIGTCVAVLASRLMQNLLPERRRPLHSDNPNFVAPPGSDNTV